MGTPATPYYDTFDLPSPRADIINWVVPALKRLTDEKVLQFELSQTFRDEPLPYRPTTEHEDGNSAVNDASHPDTLPARLVDRMEEPLSESDRMSIVDRMGADFTTPGRRYHAECWKAHRFLQAILTSAVFKGRRGQMRRGIVARHLVKHLWRAIGIWDSSWGFPGRRQYPEDDPRSWVWPWERKSRRAATAMARPSRSEQLILRALDQHNSVGRGGYVPVPPFRPLPVGAPVSFCEDFLITRPWFRFSLEVEAETQRWERIGSSERQGHRLQAVENVANWWTERGDWKRDECHFDEADLWRHHKYAMCTEWVWEHEPSFMEDGVSHLAELQEAYVNLTKIDFTPSEADAWEDVNRPDIELPDTFWRAETNPGRCGGVIYPGQIGKYEFEVFRFHEREAPSEPPISTPTHGERIKYCVKEEGVESGEDADDENGLFVRWLKSSPGASVPSVPPLRRSARIAGLKRRKEAEMCRQKAIEARAKQFEKRPERKPEKKKAPATRRVKKARTRQAQKTGAGHQKK